MAAKFELIIVGGTGDLAQRKLLPALYYLQLDGHLHDALDHIYATGRQALSTEQYLAKVEQSEATRGLAILARRPVAKPRLKTAICRSRCQRAERLPKSKANNTRPVRQCLRVLPGDIAVIVRRYLPAFAGGWPNL